ncbi:MAG TPA: glycosyltransferase family 4 protein [Candidatus Acidoferrales bacterium]|nr:glycosyltransferase family 4 protein [Candidatus Acidoferrales bacterium]
MRVAFPATHFLDPDNVKSWSGLPFFIRQALENAGVETVTIPLVDQVDLRGQLPRFLYWRWLRGKRYLRYCEVGLLKGYARQIEQYLATHPVDAVFSPSTWPIAYLKTSLPVVFWTDACFAGMLDFYGAFTRVAPPSIQAGHAAEQEALRHCARAIYSSQWAAQSALQNYQVEPGKVVVVPFGGNLQEPPTAEEAAAAVWARDMSLCNLLLVGVDWERKGADIAVDAVEALNAAGLNARLTVVGCKPPPSRRLPACVEIIPFIGKDTVEHRRQIGELYRRSHFFIMPTRAEAFGLVFAEASAFGVPCLATQVGGIPSVIIDEVNGRLFPLGAGGAEYADYIIKFMQDSSRYRELALRTAEDSAKRLSWNVSGRKVAEMLDESVRQGTSAETTERTVEAAKS